MATGGAGNLESERAEEIADLQQPYDTRLGAEPEVESERALKIDAGTVEMVPVDSLLPAFSPRIDGEDEEHIKMLADVGNELPPILVHRPTMRVIDGMHRLGAAKMRGAPMIRVQFFERSEREAFVLSVKMNIAHGRPLSLADRARAAERIIESYPRWSNRAIAASAGLSARSVADIRARMDQEGCEEITARVGMDGKVRPLDHVGGRLRAYEAFRERPGASLRQIAKIAGVSPATALDVRNRMNRGEEPASPARLARKRPVNGKSGVRHYGEANRNVLVLLRVLTADPSLRLSESGRDLLRWMHSRSMPDGEWRVHVNEVPPHCADVVAKIARQVADQWLELAGEVEQLVSEASG